MYFFFSENIHHPLIEIEEIMDLTAFATLQRLHQFINFGSFLHDCYIRMHVKTMRVFVPSFRESLLVLLPCQGLSCRFFLSCYRAITELGACSGETKMPNRDFQRGEGSLSNCGCGLIEL